MNTWNIPALTVQKGLTVMRRTYGHIPDPGPVDGIYGSRTRFALMRAVAPGDATFGVTGLRDAAGAVSIVHITSALRTTAANVVELQAAARRYRGPTVTEPAAALVAPVPGAVPADGGLEQLLAVGSGAAAAAATTSTPLSTPAGTTTTRTTSTTRRSTSSTGWWASQSSNTQALIGAGVASTIGLGLVLWMRKR